MKIGIVVITYNEERFIGMCLDSVLTAIQGFDATLVVVDSLSTDKTCLIAEQRNVPFYTIPDTALRCAALGRWIGAQKIGHCDYILFLDGDMTLHSQFLENAIAELENEPKAAGIVGINEYLYYKNDTIVKRRENYLGITDRRKAKHFGGALLVKRPVYDLVGGYDPCIFAEEETEFYSRIEGYGYCVLQIPELMVTHHTDWVPGFRKLLNLINPLNRRNYGVGQGFVRSIAKGNVRQYLQRQYDVLVNLIADLVSVSVCLTSGFSVSALRFLITVQVGELLFNYFAKGSFKWFVINKARYLHLLYGIAYYMTFQRVACKETLLSHDESYRT